jgi:mannose/cellobiose epimerase-like protein (N-acyl-D-glucosamine 2-epimerase family)
MARRAEVLTREMLHHHGGHIRETFMHKSIRARLSSVLSVLALLTVLAAKDSQAAVPGPQVNIPDLLSKLPTGERWLKHLNEDLLPYWMQTSAFGDPEGNFPTYRCNDGSLPDLAKLCPELAKPVPGIVWLDRDYVRAKARQVYAYGVAFHLTGERRYLEIMKKGVDYLSAHAIDPQGGAVTYFEGAGRTPSPSRLKRTSQDMAYAVSSFGFYYYLTRDEAVLQKVYALKDYIFNTYRDAGMGLIAWVREPSADGDETNQRELVAQLDQVYAYMMWLTPILPPEKRAEWIRDLHWLARVMIDQFYSPRQHMFWGAITTTPQQVLGTPHTDFGHSVKTLWLIRQIGKLSDDVGMAQFAQDNAAAILEQAYLKESGSWARRIDGRGKMDKDKEWWILAELDQVAATLALVDPAYARYLPRTYDYWFKYMVDHKNKEIWHWVNASDNKPDGRYPKQHSWKNSFHSFEHALIGYITAQQLHNLPVQLHFAFAKPLDADRIHPYFYDGLVVSQTVGASGVTTVSFTNVR